MRGAASRPSQVDLTRVAELGDDILREINNLREVSPVCWNDSLHSWVVSDHENVNEAFLGRKPLSCVRLHQAFNHVPADIQQREFPHVLEALPTWVLNSDPPRHTRLRLLMLNAFSRKIVERIRPFAQATIADILDEVAVKGQVEFIDEVARAITGKVIMQYLGIPAEYWKKLERWSLDINYAFGTGQASLDRLRAADRSMVEMNEVFDREIARREAEPSGDFLSELVHARDGDDRLTTEEIRGVLLVSLIAGHDTTMTTMGLSVVALTRNAEARSQLLNGKGDYTDRLMELMRYVAMSTMQIRIADEDFEWCGNSIREGDVVTLMIAGANRDPSVFPSPERIDFDQNPSGKVLSFGGGRHHCIGHYLAKMQLGEFLHAFFRRFEVEILDDPLEWWPVLSQRGLKHLNLSLTEMAAHPIDT